MGMHRPENVRRGRNSILVVRELLQVLTGVALIPWWAFVAHGVLWLAAVEGLIVLVGLSARFRLTVTHQAVVLENWLLGIQYERVLLPLQGLCIAGHGDEAGALELSHPDGGSGEHVEVGACGRSDELRAWLNERVAAQRLPPAPAASPYR